MSLEQVIQEIEQYMSVEEFRRIQDRIAFLRKEEEKKLQALAELQQTYLTSDDIGKEKVKEAVIQIRELSRAHRQELRMLNIILQNYMPLEKAKELYKRLKMESAPGYNPK